MNRHRSRGFTLIEVMIVVAIIGILAAVAYPSYKDSILKGRRAAGRAALAELLQQQERYLTQRGTYLVFANDAGAAVGTAAATTFKVYSGDNPTKPDYWLNAVTNAGACAGFTARDCIVVTAVPTQADPQAGNLSISSTGVKDCSGSFKSSNFKGCWP